METTTKIVDDEANRSINDGDWICPDSQCGNVNFARRNSCNRCGKDRGECPKKKKLGQEIGKAAAEKSRGLFSADDWQCSKCGNVNWARRQQCNMCNAPKFGEVEERTGYGGGYNDRGVVEYKERKDDDDDEYDEFGRRRKKRKIENRNTDDDDDDDEDDDRDRDDNHSNHSVRYVNSSSSPNSPFHSHPHPHPPSSVILANRNNKNKNNHHDNKDDDDGEDDDEDDDRHGDIKTEEIKEIIQEDNDGDDDDREDNEEDDDEEDDDDGDLSKYDLSEWDDFVPVKKNTNGKLQTSSRDQRSRNGDEGLDSGTSSQ